MSSVSKLSNDQKKQLRNIGHGLKPIVTIAGNGLSEGVIEELERALNDHELIKVKLVIDDRELRRQVAVEMCAQLNCTLVQTIGKVALILRENPKAKPHLSNLNRL